MKDLYVLRHATALNAEPGASDSTRALAPEGTKEALSLGKGLRKLGIELDRICASPLPRASRTAQIVGDELGIGDRVEIVPLLRSGASVEEIADWLMGRDEHALMIVGHNPEFSGLVGRLLGLRKERLPFDLKKGGLVALRSTRVGRYELRWIATPKLIDRLQG